MVVRIAKRTIICVAEEWALAGFGNHLVCCKAVEGAEAAAALYENKLALKSKKAELVTVANGLNAKKHSIDQCRAEAERMREARGADGQPGSEEVATLLKMRELKTGYRAEHEALSLLKSEVEYTQRLSKECTRQLVAQFEVWYERRYGVAVLMKVRRTRRSRSTLLVVCAGRSDGDSAGSLKPEVDSSAFECVGEDHAQKFRWL